MKIVFLCGSLELGCDGVGDYVRRLAEELAKQGNEVGAIALNDQNTAEEFVEADASNGVYFSTLRIPSAWPEKQRFNTARSWIELFNPDWISLQFVIFSYHPKGLPFGIVKAFSELSEGRKLHIMFHELWVGMAVDSSLKLTLWGWIQRNIILSLIKTAKPSIIHTQTRLYQSQIAKLGFDSHYLPLFSNIPVINNAASFADDDAIRLVVFGTIHPGAPVEQFAEEVVVYARSNNKQISLTIIGRNGLEQKRWATVFQARNVPVELLGEQTATRVSQVLGESTHGISTTPNALVEKSGTVAAMREHGLPVLTVSVPWKINETIPMDKSGGVFEYEAGKLGSYFNQAQQINFSSTVSNIAQQLLADLSSSLKRPSTIQAAKYNA